MNHSTTLLTGATGGIGRAIAAQLYSAGESLLLIGRCEQKLKTLQQELRESEPSSAACVAYLVADIATPKGRDSILDLVTVYDKPITRLINNAGVNAFGMFEDQSADAVQEIMNTNALAPIQLIHLLLPHLLKQERADIINIGSTFGSIGYPGFSSYSASKFALRGFTEALAREYANSNIRIRYFAPRATKTELNCSQVEKMNAELNVQMDSPDLVAYELALFLYSGKNRASLGWPEKGFAQLNQLFPSLVGHFINKDLKTIREYAKAKLAA